MVSSHYGGGTGRVRGFPGDLEWRARPRRRGGDSRRAGASRGILSRPRGPSGRPASWDRSFFRDEDVLDAWLEGRSILLTSWRKSGFALQFSFLCPRSLWGRAGLAALGPGVAAAPEAGGVDDKFVCFRRRVSSGLA